MTDAQRQAAFSASTEQSRQRSSRPWLRGIAVGEPLVGHTLAVEWGSWGRLGPRFVLATGSLDGTVRLWDPHTSKQIGKTLAGHTASVTWGVWGQVDKRPVLATGSLDGTVYFWDPTTREQHYRPLIGNDTAAKWGAWGNVNGRQVLATGHLSGQVHLWDPTAREQPTKPLIGHTASVTWGAWEQVQGSAVLATGSIDGTVRLWDPVTGESVGELPTDCPSGASWGTWAQAKGRSLLAAGSPDGSLHLWDLTKGARNRLSQTNLRAGGTWGAWARIHGSPRLATGNPDGTVRLWDTGGKRHSTPVTGALATTTGWGAWGQIGQQPVLAIGDDLTVSLWYPDMFPQRHEPLSGHTAPIVWGSWGQADGRPMLATGSVDGTIRLWEVVEDRAVQRLPTYRSDAAGEADALSRTGDALALAELITARTVRPPLAVGLFGDWGEGKSHFLNLLREHVTTTAHPDNQLAHHDIRQVSFNAWHYAETDLWASLVAELFSQLASPGESADPAEYQRQQSRLMAEVIAKRELPQRLRAARDRRDGLQHAVRRANRDTIPSWAKLKPAQQQDLKEIGKGDAEKFYRSTVNFGSGAAEGGRAAWRFLAGIPRRTVLTAGAVVLVLIAIAVGIVLVLPAVSRWWASLLPVAAIVGVVGQTWVEAKRRASPVWRAVSSAVQAIVRADESERARVQTAAAVAAEEVKALEREMKNLHAAGQLAGFAAERAGDGGYRGRLGVMTQIREDFQRMANLLSEAHNQHEFSERSGGRLKTDLEMSPHQPDVVGDELPRIDRIVLYIDDLDRCPPQRVVAMLEAIHLLLALDLFVVVVAVDPRWLLRAITSHYKDLLHTTIRATDNSGDGMVDLNDDELWAATPAQYLEKIFQVVLTLPPLDASGYQFLLRTLVGTRPGQPSSPPTPPSPAAAPTSVPVGADYADNPNSINDADDASESMFGTRLPTARVVERVDPLTLDPGELALLDLLGPPTLITTPRAVKRLANSYGLLTALRHAERAGDLAPLPVMINDLTSGEFREVSHYPYRAGLVLLGALVAFPALGPALLVHLHRSAAADQHSTWTAFVQSLEPHRGDKGAWSNAADDVMTTVQAQNWRTLHRGLAEVTDLAAAADLTLPDLLVAWAEWIVPVGRLSFPAGRIVNNLRHYRPY